MLYSHWYLKGRSLPTRLISDRDSLFTSAIYQKWCNQVGIHQAMSTARHQQTNGGAESSVKLIKQVLKGFVDYHEANWTRLLGAAQFAINNSIHTTTGFTPFFLAYAFQPATFPMINSPTTTLERQFTQYRTALERAHSNVYKAELAMSKQYNKARTTGFEAAVGKQVLLARDGIAWGPDANRSRLLLSPYLGPFTITAIDETRDNVTLQLPAHMRCHNVFHISKIREYIGPNEHFPTRAIPEPTEPACTVDGHAEYEVEKVLDYRVFRKKPQYLVKWKGYSDKETTWEPEEFLTHCSELIAEYRQGALHSEPKPPPTKGRNGIRSENAEPEGRTSHVETGPRGSVLDPAPRRSQRVRTGVLRIEI